MWERNTDELRMSEPRGTREWVAVAERPPAYTIVMLAFEDGSVRRGVWNGKLWWGYDERVKRACELHPVRWRLWTGSVLSSRSRPRAAAPSTIERATI
jgi:hypothetical protein